MNNPLEFFIRQTAKITLIPEDVVDKVIRSQWKYANEATQTYTEVEVTELGIFQPSAKKVITRLKQLDSKISYITDNNHNTTRSNKIIEDATLTYNYLKENTNDIVEKYLEKQERNTRRALQQSVPEGGNRESEETET